MSTEPSIDLPITDLRLGALPSPTGLIPRTSERLYTMSAIAALGTIAGASAFGLGLLPAAGLGGLAASLVPLMGRFDSAFQRGGYIGDRPSVLAPVEGDSSPDKLHHEATALVRAKTNNDSLTVRERTTAQYRVLTVRNLDPKPLAALVDNIAILLGADPDDVIFIPTFSQATSAYLVPLPEDQWQDIPYTTEYLIKGELIGYIGTDIRGKPITYNRRIYPHGLFAGTTGSGKTAGMRADIQAMRDSGLNPLIYIADLKGDFEGIECEQHIIKPDTEGGLALFRQEVAALIRDLMKQATQRLSKYAKAGARNFFQYREIDNTERPILLYIDELAALVSGTGEKKDKSLLMLIAEVARLFRAAGLFLTIGIQRPDAELLTGELKSNIGFMVAFAHVNNDSSMVTLDKTLATRLPMLGGLLFKVVGKKSLILGRGVSSFA